MRLNLPQKIDKKQWLARLGVPRDEDARLLQQLELAEAKLLHAAAPQGVYRVLELKRETGAGGEDLSAGGVELPGNAIKKHLTGCNGMIVMAVTLGAAVDRLIRTAQVRDMAEAVILDSGASVLAEQCADILEGVIRAEIGGFTTGRYSPGYGDFPIQMQRDFTKFLDTHRQIGLAVNENYILTPRKSITAIAGLADHPVKGYLATCDECLLKESCGLRKEGKQCWT